MLVRFFGFALYHPRLAVLLLLLLSGLLIPGLQQLQIGTDFSRLIPDSAPDKHAYRGIVRQFGSDNKTLVYVADTDLWRPAQLAALRQLHRDLENLPFVERVDSLYSLHGLKFQDGALDSGPLIERIPGDTAALHSLREKILETSLVPGNFLSPGGSATALLVAVKPSSLHGLQDIDVFRSMENVLEPFRAAFETLFQVGPARINAELDEALKRDIVLLGPVSAMVLIVTLLLFMRSLLGALLPLLTSLLSIAWTLGLMGWADVPLTLLSAMLPSLVIAIGSTEDTHLMSSYLQSLDAKEPVAQRRRTATLHMLRTLALPILLTILTTSLGFAANLFNDISLVREFATVSAAAILLNGIATWLLVPLMLGRFGPLRSTVDLQGRKRFSPVGLLVRLFGLTRQRFSRGLLLVTGLLCAFFLYQAAKLHVTNDPLSYFKENRQLIADVTTAQEQLNGLSVFYVTLRGSDMKAFLEPDNLRKLEKIQAFIAQQAVFDTSLSLLDFLKPINREFHEGKERYYRIPRTREQVAQYLMFPRRNDLAPYVSHDFRDANIVVRHSISDSQTLNNHVNELRTAVRQIAGGDFNTFVVGENLMVNAAAERLLVGQVQSLAVLLVVIFLIMSAIFTSFKGGVIGMIPAVIPITLMFGVMGMLDIPLNPGTAMVAVIAVGIAIDSTVHLLSRYNELCRRTSDYEQAVQQTVEQEALPTVTTSLALALGFGLLLLSEFSVVAQFGALSAATMLFSIFANLLITPLIMTRVRLVGLYEILAMTVHREVLDHSPLFSGMSRYEIRKTILISELNEFAAGDLLVKQGTHARSMYLILNGSAEVRTRSESGSQQVALLKEGDVFGEIGFIRPTRRTADVRALTPIQALRYDFETIRRDLRFFPHLVAKLNFNISVILGERLASTLEQRTASQDPVQAK